MEMFWATNLGPVSCATSQWSIDLIHDTLLLYTHLRTDGIKEMSRAFSGDEEVIKFANTRNRGRVDLF